MNSVENETHLRPISENFAMTCQKTLKLPDHVEKAFRNHSHLFFLHFVLRLWSLYVRSLRTTRPQVLLSRGHSLLHQLDKTQGYTRQAEARPNRARRGGREGLPGQINQAKASMLNLHAPCYPWSSCVSYLNAPNQQ